MSDFKALARILAAVQESEKKGCADMACFSVNALKTDEDTRDRLAYKLQKDGYIEGLLIIDDIDNQTKPYIMWNNSYPTITIKGMEFIEESKPLRKAIDEIKSLAAQTAAQIITNRISQM